MQRTVLNIRTLLGALNRTPPKSDGASSRYKATPLGLKLGSVLGTLETDNATHKSRGISVSSARNSPR
jgi:DNA-binding HxlR family transcriptional regulator